MKLAICELTVENEFIKLVTVHTKVPLIWTEYITA